jgi:hypothetical protein
VTPRCDGSCVLTQSGTDTTLVDPQLDSPTTGPCATPLADGSCLATLPLAAGSPAIDAGSCFAGSVTVDQRGLSRPFDEPGASNADDACDAGAVEWTDSNGNGIDDGIEIFLDGFESGDTSGWSATGP